MDQREENVQGQAACRSSTVKLRIEAHGFYPYKWSWPPACMRGPASVRSPASITTCQLCVSVFKNHQPVCTSTGILFIFTVH